MKKEFDKHETPLYKELFFSELAVLYKSKK